jgi:hypothetical protein
MRCQISCAVSSSLCGRPALSTHVRSSVPFVSISNVKSSVHLRVDLWLKAGITAASGNAVLCNRRGARAVVPKIRSMSHLGFTEQTRIAEEPSAAPKRQKKPRREGYAGVDRNEDAEATGFQKVQPVSTSSPHLIETEAVENRHRRTQAGICLGRRGSGVQIAPPRPTDSS